MRERIGRLLEKMSRGAYEREEALGLSLLSALAGESIFLLGLPGVGKSMIARRLKMAFRGAAVFEYLMSRFSTPDEIFGPVSISRLKEEDSYERVTAGYLPEAEVVFLDEIWKAGPAIQNSLLTVLNEKIYLNGNRVMKLPLKGVVAASNELPAEDEGLEALWDRFIIRYVVNPIGERENFFRLIEERETPDDYSAMELPEALSDEDYRAIRRGSGEVMLPKLMLDIIFSIRERLQELSLKKDPVTGDSNGESRKFYVSDRRWRKAAGVIRTSAYLNGRSEADISDLFLLCHILWNEENGIETVKRIVIETSVSVLFKRVLDSFKSEKRHASPSGGNISHLYSPDGKHYVIEVEGSPMRIAISDYEKIMKSPADIHFGSETADGRIMLRKQGQYVIRWVKHDYIGINNFTYALRTMVDEELGRGFLQGLGDSVIDIANGLYASVNGNMFLAKSALCADIRTVAGVYKERFGRM